MLFVAPIASTTTSLPSLRDNLSSLDDRLNRLVIYKSTVSSNMVEIEEVPVADHGAVVAGGAVAVLAVAVHPHNHNHHEDHNVVSTGDEQDSDDIFDDQSDGGGDSSSDGGGGEEDDDDDDDDNDDEDDDYYSKDDEDRAYHRRWGHSRGSDTQSRTNNNDDDDHNDLLYDENLDIEDEAYVYRHLRGGIQEKVTILEQTRTRSQQQQQRGQGQHRNRDDGNSGRDDVGVTATTTTRRKSMSLYKPRTSDAVLSCPCCFNIVCMDCQRHQRYMNQFRAMFVMGISVDWHKILVYDDVKQALIPRQGHDHPEDLPESGCHDGMIPHDLSATSQPRMVPPPTREGEFFSVECANCGTQVAALDMKVEVYHFFGCLESSATGTVY